MWVLGRSLELRCRVWAVECISTAIPYSAFYPKDLTVALCRFSRICLIRRHSPTALLRDAQMKVSLPKTLIPGLSLFSLLSHTNTPQGSATLRQWFLSPLQSVEAIVERQNAITFFEANVIAEQVQTIRTGLKKMGDVHSGLNTIRRGGSPRKR